MLDHSNSVAWKNLGKNDALPREIGGDMGCGAEHVFPAIHRVYRSWRLKVPSGVPKTTPTATSMAMLSYIASTRHLSRYRLEKLPKYCPCTKLSIHSIRFQSNQSDGELSFRLRPKYGYLSHKLNAPTRQLAGSELARLGPETYPSYLPDIRDCTSAATPIVRVGARSARCVVASSVNQHNELVDTKPDHRGFNR